MFRAFGFWSLGFRVWGSDPLGVSQGSFNKRHCSVEKEVLVGLYGVS